MSEKNLKVVSAPESKTSPGAASQAPAKSGLMARIGTGRLRMFLLVVLPTIAVLIGLTIYLLGGRYISTDNAFIGAQKVLITPDISGKVVGITVREGQHVNPGDILLTLDPVPYQLALDQAKAKLNTAQSDYDKAKSNLASFTKLADLAQKNVELKQNDVDRKTKLAASQAGSAADVDTALGALVTAQLQAEFTIQQRELDAQFVAGRCQAAGREISRICPGEGGARRCATQPQSYHAARADFRHRHPGRQYPARTLCRRRLADPERDRRPGALGRCQSERDRHHLFARRPEGGSRCR